MRKMERLISMLKNTRQDPDVYDAEAEQALARDFLETGERINELNREFKAAEAMRQASTSVWQRFKAVYIELVSFDDPDENVFDFERFRIHTERLFSSRRQPNAT